MKLSRQTLGNLLLDICYCFDALLLLDYSSDVFEVLIFLADLLHTIFPLAPNFLLCNSGDPLAALLRLTCRYVITTSRVEQLDDAALLSPISSVGKNVYYHF